MYNSVTQEKIRLIPQISTIDIDRLPEELTRIFAQIVSLRQELAAGMPDSMAAGVDTLRRLAGNLETILLTDQAEDNREAIAFVAATAHALIHQIFEKGDQIPDLSLDYDSLSSLVSGTLLFLIGNSQADSSEISRKMVADNLPGVRSTLVRQIQSLAKGNLENIVGQQLTEELIATADLTDLAFEYLWLEIARGIQEIAVRLLGREITVPGNHFDKVVELSVYYEGIFQQNNIFGGPLHLAKLLKVLELDVLTRGVVFTPAPNGTDAILWSSFLDEIAKSRPYLWENHVDAISSGFLDVGVSAVMTLPTGSGKTTLSELKIASCLFSGKRVLYIVPTHALKDQVNRTLAETFRDYSSDNVVLDGEHIDVEVVIKQISVMTPERCLALFNISPEFFTEIGLIVFDEFHLIHGQDLIKDARSIDAMFCLLMIFEKLPNADYLLISAMVENGDEIMQWLQSITNRRCVLFNSSWKPTRQLHGCVVYQQKGVGRLQRHVTLSKLLGKTKNPSSKLRTEIALKPFCLFSLKNIWETDDPNDYFAAPIMDNPVSLALSGWRLTPNRNNVAAELAIHYARLGLKTLVFVDIPASAIRTAKQIGKVLQTEEDSHESFFIGQEENVEHLRLELGDLKHSFVKNVAHVGVHHGALLGLERFLIEEYFKSPTGCSILVATATLAQGINLPAEVVIIAGDDRFDPISNSMQKIPPHILLNAAGRAGRAGLASQGAVIVIPGRIATIRNGVATEPWQALKEEVFSKPDQCLKIEDPLGHFIDSMQANGIPMSIQQINILYRLQPSKLSEASTKAFFSRSFSSFKSARDGDSDNFSRKVEILVARRDQLAELSEDVKWVQEVSYKTGLDPAAIISIESFVDSETLERLLELPVAEIVPSFLSWIANNPQIAKQLFNKERTLISFAALFDINPKLIAVEKICEKIPVLITAILAFITATPLNEINSILYSDEDEYLDFARHFVLKVIPDISFLFGVLTMVIVEKCLANGLSKQEVPLTIRALSGCLREGFDTPDKLFYKINSNLPTRVSAHIAYNAQAD